MINRSKKEPKQMDTSKSAVKQILGGSKPKKEYIYRAYYIEPHHKKALDFERARTGKDLSEIVREIFDAHFGDTLEKYKD